MSSFGKCGLKWDWAAALSLISEARHFSMNSRGVTFHPPNTSATIAGGWGGASIGRRVSRCYDAPPLPPFSDRLPYPRPQKFARPVSPPCPSLRALTGRLRKKFPDADLSAVCHPAPPSVDCSNVRLGALRDRRRPPGRSQWSAAFISLGCGVR